MSDRIGNNLKCQTMDGMSNPINQLYSISAAVFKLAFSLVSRVAFTF